jgi:hypothetical protein
MKLETRLEKLEAATPTGHCPHEHNTARFIKPDGSDSIAREGPKTCECGREIITREIQFVPYAGTKQNETRKPT